MLCGNHVNFIDGKKETRNKTALADPQKTVIFIFSKLFPSFLYCYNPAEAGFHTISFNIITFIWLKKHNVWK